MGYCHWLSGQRISTIWGGKHKFVCWAFTLEANSNNFQNVYVVALFASFDAKSLYNGRKFIEDKNGNPNSPQTNKLFFPNSYKLHNFIFFRISTLSSVGKFVQGPLYPTAVMWSAPTAACKGTLPQWVTPPGLPVHLFLRIYICISKTTTVYEQAD